jgi:hypothetical protein
LYGKHFPHGTVKRNAMAKLNENVFLPLSLQGISVYRMKGVDRMVVRRKGGPGAKAIKKSGQFINTRRHNAEFASAASAVAHLRHSFRPLVPIHNGNIMPALISLCWKILKKDTVHGLGEREVQFSHHRPLLEEVNLNPSKPFDAVIKCSFRCRVQKAKPSVTIQVPALVKRRNLALPRGFAYYRLIFTLGLLQDAPAAKQRNHPVHTVSAWTKCSSGMPAQGYTLTLPSSQTLAAGSSLVIGVGVEMSMDGERVVRGVGVGRVWKVV